MIQNDDELQLTFEQLGRMYKVLAHFRATILSVNPKQYDLFAEGPLDEIRKLQADINSYLDLPDITAANLHESEAASVHETPAPYGGTKKT